MATAKEIPLPFPVKGKSTNAGYDRQAPETTVDCANVCAFDAGVQRLRGGQRPGFAAQSNKVNASSYAILRLHQAVASVSNVSVTRLLAITDGTDRSIYWTSGLGAAWALTTGGGTVIANGATEISTCDIFGKMYTVDGTNLYVTDCNLATPVTTTLAAPAGNTWTVASTGNLIGGTADAFQYAQQSVTGDFDVKLQIPSFTYNQAFARAALLARAGTAAGDASFGMFLQPSSPYYFGARATAAATMNFTAGVQSPAGVNTWVRLKRVGDVYTGYSSADGSNWTQVGGYNSGGAPLGATIKIGFAVSGGGVAASATFQNVTGGPGGSYVGTDVGATSGGSTATSASQSAGSPVSGTITVNYMGRLAISGNPADPQNIFFSRSGVPGDFDYSQVDALAAVALNESPTIGRVGQWIKALIPWTRDEMLIGCQHSLFLMRGDPASGGTVQLISDNVGIVGKDAWCTDPIGNIYFVGTGGFYRLPANWGYRQQPEQNLSINNVNTLIASLSGAGSPKITCAYDAVRQAIWIFFTRTDGQPSTHLLYDLRTEGFFPQSFTTLSDNPRTAIGYNAYDSGQQSLLIGNQTSQLLVLTDGQKNDNGAAIVSFCCFGPQRPHGTSQARLTSMQIYLAEQGPYGASDQNVTVTVQAAKDSYSSFAAPDRTFSQTLTAYGRQNWGVQRLTGGAFTFKLANAVLNKTWAMEAIVASFVEAGMQR